jgi:signal recognition particle subunit SEC65
MKKEVKTEYRYRSSVDGRFIPKDKAVANPRESEKERIKNVDNKIKR